MTSWAPILDGSLAAEARSVITEIAACARRSAISDPTLATGSSAEALLFAYLFTAHARESDRASAAHFLELAFAHADALSPGLHTGLAGLAWTAEHVRGLCIADDDVNEDVDAGLLEHVRSFRPDDQWDLHSGLIGIGVYCLERSTAVASAALALVIDRVLAVARRTDAGMSWALAHPPSQIRSRYPQGAASLGMAHGAASVIAFWRVACNGDLGEALRWLYAQRLANTQFPAAVSLDGTPGSPAPFCWCNGEPGLAIGLGSLELALQAAARSPDDTPVPDASVCCGASGIALCFARLAHRFDRAELHAAARTWFGRAIALARERGPYEPGLLRGHAGIALALLAAVTPVEPRWDRVLLLS